MHMYVSLSKFIYVHSNFTEIYKFKYIHLNVNCMFYKNKKE